MAKKGKISTFASRLATAIPHTIAHLYGDNPDKTIFSTDEFIQKFSAILQNLQDQLNSVYMIDKNLAEEMVEEFQKTRGLKFNLVDNAKGGKFFVLSDDQQTLGGMIISQAKAHGYFVDSDFISRKEANEFLSTLFLPKNQTNHNEIIDEATKSIKEAGEKAGFDIAVVKQNTHFVNLKKAIITTVVSMLLGATLAMAFIQSWFKDLFNNNINELPEDDPTAEVDDTPINEEGKEDSLAEEKTSKIDLEALVTKAREGAQTFGELGSYLYGAQTELYDEQNDIAGRNYMSPDQQNEIEAISHNTIGLSEKYNNDIDLLVEAYNDGRISEEEFTLTLTQLNSQINYEIVTKADELTKTIMAAINACNDHDQKLVAQGKLAPGETAHESTRKMLEINLQKVTDYKKSSQSTGDLYFKIAEEYERQFHPLRGEWYNHYDTHLADAAAHEIGEDEGMGGME